MQNEPSPEQSLKSLQFTIESYRSIIAGYKFDLELALWNVGVAAPGLLGLAGSVAALQKCSALTPWALTGAYRLSLYALLLSVVAAIVYHAEITRRLKTIETDANAAFSQMSNMATRPTSSTELNRYADKINKITEKLKERTQRNNELAQKHQWKGRLPKFQRWLLLVGYIAFGVLLGSVSFSRPCS